MGDGPRDCDALHFTAGQQPRRLVRNVTQAESIERSEGCATGQVRVCAEVSEAEQHVVIRRPVRQQVEMLVNDSDRGGPHGGPFVRSGVSEVGAAQGNPAGRGDIEESREVEKGRFSGSGRAR